MWPTLERYAPGAVLGTFLARCLGELFGMPGWPAAIVFTVILALSAGWLLSRRPFHETWPAFLLLTYVVYPEADLPLGAFVALVALMVWLQIVAAAKQIRAGRRIRLAVLFALAAGFFLLYARTLAPGVLPADSGELQVVAANLGVAHPPGFPLYTMLGHLWTLLPIGPDPAYRLNMFSAVSSTLTLVMVYLTTLRFAGRRPLLAALTAAIALGTATTYWAQATTANIRSLTALFTALALYCLVRFGQSMREEQHEGTASNADRWLILTALTLGLGITHHISLAFLALVALAYVLLVDRTLWRMPRRWVLPIMAGLAGLLPLLYLPLRANSGARGASPQLASWRGFLDHVLATGFRGDLFYFTDPQIFWERLRVMGNILTFQFLPILLIGMFAGLLLLLMRDRLLALLWGGTAIIFTLVAVTYRAPQTVEYMMPAYVALALCLGYAVGQLPDPQRPTRSFGLAFAQLFSALLLVSALNQGWQRFGSYDALHRDTSARDYAGQLLAEAPPGTEILSHWHWATAIWYLQEVKGQRPDITTEFVFPEGESYAETWARRVREAYDTGKPVITTFYDQAAYEGLPIPYPIGEAYLFRHDPVTELPAGYEPFSATLGGVVELVGYRQETATTQAGEPAVLTLAWQPLGDLPEGLALFAHLIGPDDRVYGQSDVPAQPQPGGLAFTQFRVTPRPSTPLETLRLSVGAYAQEPLLDLSGNSQIPVSNLTVRPNNLPPFTQQPLARHELSVTQREMVGYDWDRTLSDRQRLYLHWKLPDGYWTEVLDGGPELPDTLDDLPPYRGPWGVARAQWSVPAFPGLSHYIPFGDGIIWTGDTLAGSTYDPGQSFTLDQHLSSDRPILRDYVVSTRLIGLQDEGPLWAWWDLVDSVPGLGAVPTLKWIHGANILSPHTLALAESAVEGQKLIGALILYDAFTNRPLPILDERITAETPWVPLGNGVVGK